VVSEVVDARTRTEDALRESERRYRQLAETMPQLVWTAGSDGVVDYYNSRAAEFSGIEQAPDGTWRWQPVVHPDDLERTTAAWQEAAATRQPYHCEHRIRMADGSFRWHLSRAVPVAGEDGTLKWFGTATDIHDLRSTQEALRQSEEELRRAAAELSEADRRKNEFLATLAHELRNPLSPIRNALQVLRLKGSEDPEILWGQDMIDRQVRHLTRLIDDLLDVSRITRNRLELRKERVALTEILYGAVESSRPLIHQYRHKLAVTLPPEPVELEADVVRLTQVFLNLLNNAIKYTPAGGRIWLTARRAGGEVVISVRDTGIGIPADQLAHLFEMFYQVDRSLERSTSGLGIGLTLVQRLVEMHGGRIEARSAGPGQGSEFIVHLPAAAEPPETAVPRPAAAPQEMITRRILVVDDNRDSAESLALLLELGGHEVQTASDGVEALEVAERFRPDVALLDLGMPRLNGYEAARRIRQQPWGRSMVLIAQTGWGQEDDRRRTREAGFDAHLTKPVDTAALLELLRGV
jgi:two-component system CheB/CheR fusion protein